MYSHALSRADKMDDLGCQEGERAGSVSVSPIKLPGLALLNSKIMNQAGFLLRLC